MIDAFGVRKDWWEEPAPSRRDKHVLSPQGKVAAGVGAGAVLGAGAVYLATRGKGSQTVKTITRTIKAKPAKVKTSAPKAPKPSGPVVTVGGKKIRLKRKGEPKQLTLLDSKGQVREPKASKKTPLVQTQAPVTPTHSPAAKAKHGTASLKATGAQRDDIARATPADHTEPYDEALVARGGEASISDTATLRALAEAEAKAKQARAARRAAGQMHGKQGAKPRKATPPPKPPEPVDKMDQKILAKRFALDVYDEIWKADLTMTGEPGDKRNTKYALAGGAGYVAGANLGSYIGARAAGTTYAKNRQQVHEAVKAHTDAERAKRQKKFDAYKSPQVSAEARRNYNPFARKALYYDPRNPPPEPASRYQRVKQKMTRKKVVLDPNTPKNPATYSPSVKTLARIHNSVKGTKAIVDGSMAGAALGVGVGAGSLALYRNDKKKRAQARLNPPAPTPAEEVTKAEDPRKKIDMKTGAVLGGIAGAASGNAVAIPAARMAAKMGKKGKAGQTFTRSLIRFNKSPIVLAPIGLGIGLGAIGGKGAKDMRDKEIKKALWEARMADDPVVKAWTIPLKPMATKGAKVTLNPVQGKKFVEYDPIIAAQRKRAAMKRTT